MDPHLASGQDGVPAHVIYEFLQLCPAVFDEMLLVPAGDLLVGQRRYGDDVEFFREPVVQPIEVFVSAGDFDVGKRRG